MSVRCFIAVGFEDAIASQLAGLQKQIAQRVHEAGISTKGIKWVKPENMHLTLKFFGDIADTDIPKICDAMDKTAETCQIFEMSIEGYGCFGSGGSARVLWAGIELGRDELTNMYHKLQQELSLLQFSSDDRRFKPHLTLARIKNHQTGMQLQQVAQQLPSVIVPVHPVVVRLSLLQSDLTPNGPVYSVLHHAELND